MFIRAFINLMTYTGNGFNDFRNYQLGASFFFFLFLCYRYILLQLEINKSLAAHYS